MRIPLMTLLALAAAGSASLADPVLIDGFEAPLAWSFNEDGGVRPEFELSREHSRSGQALHIVYTNRKPEWGNLIRPLALPATAGAFDFWVYRAAAKPKAAMHLWLFEEDGDAWASALLTDGVRLNGLARGWHHYSVDLGEFKHQPRGDKQPDLSKVNRLLLGSNFGDLEVYVDDLSFRPREETTSEWEELDDGLVRRRTWQLGEGGQGLEEVLGAGWWDAETERRWTGRDRKPPEIKLPATPGRDITVALPDVALNPLVDDGPVEVVWLLDGEELLRQEYAEQRATLEITVPAERLREGEHVLAIQTPLFVPQERGEGADTRSLGIKAARIEMWTFERPPLELNKGERGSIGIWREDDPGVPVVGVASDPDRLASVFARAGYGATFLTTAHLLSPAVLTRENFDLLALPYAASYPANGQRALLRYLREGGDFISLGGYAFDNPLVRRNGRWVDESTLHSVSPGAFVDIGSAEREPYLTGDWYAAESGHEEWGGAPGRVSKRWTGRRAGVTLQVDPAKAHTLKVSLAYCGAEWHRAHVTKPKPVRVRLLCNGEELLQHQGESGVIVLEGEIKPEQLGGKAEVSIELVCDTWVPTQVSDVSDERELGVAVNWIKLIPEGTDEAALTRRASEFDRHINTHFGKPQDSLGVTSDQLGVFDPGYPLRPATRLVAAREQRIWPSDVAIDGQFEGWAASTMAANNSAVFPDLWARRVPLLQAYDEGGRYRGSAAALARHWRGPYVGSNWAIFGVTTEDLAPRLQDELVRLADAMLHEPFLRHVETEWACYREGEEVNVTVHVRGNGRTEQEATVAVTAVPADAGPDDAPEQEHRLSVRAPAVGEAAATVKFRARGPADLWRVRVRLLKGEREVDALETGYCVWNEQVVQDGPKITFADNYFCIDGRPTLLLGTNITGAVFHSLDENPLLWDRDFRLMQDHGMNVLRILHFSPFVAEPATERKEPLDLAGGMPPKLARQLDAIVQLCQKRRVVLFLSLHDWMGVMLSDEELAAQKAFAAHIAERYAGVPGIIYDVQNEPSVSAPDWPHVRQLWNQWLREKYRTMDALRAAWGASAPEEEWDDIPVAPGEQDWTDLRTRDVERFKNVLLNRWVKANADGVWAEDEARPVTVGYLPWMYPADKLVGNDLTTFSNMHYYGAGSRFPREFKITDQRFRGKSLSVGEMGAKPHPAWGQKDDPEQFVGVTHQQAARWFQRIGHYCFGLGGSMMCNWDLKDMTGCIFPWGVIHPHDGVPKPGLLSLRSLGFLLRDVRPRYVEPEVYLLVADSHRFGPQQRKVTEAILATIDRLLERQVPFGVINEWSLDQLPETAKLLMYPVPFCPSQETYQRVVDFVRAGGTLYFSGDISYDEDRERTQTGRLEELVGASGEPRYPPLQEGAVEAEQSDGVLKATVRPAVAVRDRPALSKTESGWCVLLEHAVGQGHVLWCSDPLELHSVPEHGPVYERALQLAGVTRPDAEAPPNLHVMWLPAEGGEVWILYNAGAEPQSARLAGKYEIMLAPQRPGFLHLSDQGDVLAVGGTDTITVEGATIADGDGVGFGLRALDNQDVRRSRALLTHRMEPGELRILCRGGAWEAAAGSVQEGEFREHRRWQPARDGERLRVTIGEPEALELVLLTAEGGGEAAVKALTRYISLR